jgi:hypothetical protein
LTYSRQNGDDYRGYNSYFCVERFGKDINNEQMERERERMAAPLLQRATISHGYASIKDIHSPTRLIRVPCPGTALFTLLAKIDFERNHYYFVTISNIDMMGGQSDCKPCGN